MSQPLTAVYRITVIYTVVGKEHKQRAYCDVDDDTVATPDLVDRSGGNTISWIDAAQDMWDAICRILPNTVSDASALLEKRSGTIWNPLGAFGVVGDGQLTTFSPASELTIVLRDTAFKKLRYVIMEGGLGYIGHSTSGRGIFTEVDGIIDAIDGTSSSAAKAYLWMKSRGNRYLLAAGMVAGATFDLNDKMKAARGLV